MKLPSAVALLLSAALMAQQVQAKLTWTVKGTQNGVPIPPSEIILKPFEAAYGHNFGPSGPTTAAAAASVGRVARNRMVKRANPIATSANWCGSVRNATTSNRIKLIHGYFQHPTCTKRAGVTTYPQAAASWIGIDGDSSTTLLQMGTVCKIDNSTGIVRNEAWWQWVPDAAMTLASMPVHAGDWFQVTINTTSATSAVISLTNVNTLTAITINLSAGTSLARIDADWIVERPAYGSGLAGFASFTETWFQEAYATLANGASLGILGAKQYQITGGCSSAEYDNADLSAWS
ncbi:concanavalin A-like lectin/glucanase domain-containing protein [Cercophora scortea]|uniref:Concanavalin A-like lectin/glucanase domain-containing protein n=1 Tax=Cercophora scortea TaxID=314031 RepID=A0AAE0IW54_9PEZI|nr:concanavalin A-like lectin/glucanase domain-containing protein [Cercophora scortea]